MRFLPLFFLALFIGPAFSGGAFAAGPEAAISNFSQLAVSSDFNLFYKWKPADSEMQGPVLLFLNGIDKDMSQWDFIISSLAETNPSWSFLQVDLIGQGQTSYKNPPFLAPIPPAKQMDLVKQLMQRLGLEGKEIILIGHSYGGGIAAALAKEMPGAFANVIMLAPFVDNLESYQLGMKHWMDWIRKTSEMGGLKDLYDYTVLASSTFAMAAAWPLNSFYRMSSASLIDVLNLTYGIRSLSMNEAVKNAGSTKLHLVMGFLDEMIPQWAHENLWFTIPEANRGTKWIVTNFFMWGHELTKGNPSAVTAIIRQVVEGNDSKPTSGK